MYIIDKEYNETWRTVKEEIKGTYLKEATLFPYVFLEQCKNNPNVLQNTP